MDGDERSNTSLPIGSVHFDILSPEEAIAMSVMQVTSAATYDKAKPKPGGLMVGVDVYRRR